MKPNKKEFDAVAIMRRIRDELSRRFQGMSFCEQKAYIEKRMKSARSTNRKKPHAARKAERGVR